MNKTFVLVSAHDPAWAALEPEVLAKYVAGGGREEDLPAWPDAVSPVRYTCKRLSRNQVLREVGGIASDAGKIEAAFVRGVVKIDGGHFGDGWEPEHAKNPKAGRISDEELEDKDISPDEILDIGAAILARSSAPKGSAPRYPRQPSYLDAWAANARQYAARREASAAQSSSPPRGE